MHRTLLLFVLLLLAFAPVPPYKPKPLPEDLKAMQGEWKLVLWGPKDRQAQPKGCLLVDPVKIDGNLLKGFFRSDYQMILNPNRNPKIIHAKGIESGEINQIILFYKLEGDTLTIRCPDFFRLVFSEHSPDTQFPEMFFTFERKKP